MSIGGQACADKGSEDPHRQELKYCYFYIFYMAARNITQEAISLCYVQYTLTVLNNMSAANSCVIVPLVTLVEDTILY
jgi:hypothetical protein